MRKFNILIILLLTFNFIQAQEIVGDWYGTLKVQGTELPLVFHVQKKDSIYTSTMDSPKQGAFDIKVDLTQYENSNLDLKILQMGINYEGSFDSSAEKINGTFKQGAMSFPLNLTRENIVEKVKRPQEPKEPFPYSSENITFYNKKDNINLAGTLTLPENKEDFPTVILISGSGPQDRNDELFDHKPFLVLSDYLTRQGIAVLRYDDRGVAESEGDFSAATSKDFSTDVEAAINYLRSRKEINKNKIGLIGHSEGGIIAPMVAKDSKNVNFMVLLAGTGLRGDKLMLLQKKLIEEKSGIDQISINKSQEVFKEAYDLIISSEEKDEELKSTLKQYFNEKLNNTLSDDQLTGLVETLTSKWMKYFLKYDPSTALQNTEIPVLALFGENDLQVPSEENSRILKESLAIAENNNATILTLEDLNHLFQESKTGLPNEYSEIEQTISPKVLDIISNWINELN
jgi:pimeloyl-ACP methyl ester carboxylesterase